MNNKQTERNIFTATIELRQQILSGPPVWISCDSLKLKALAQLQTEMDIVWLADYHVAKSEPCIPVDLYRGGPFRSLLIARGEWAL